MSLKSVILAGGKSSRMGLPKYTLPIKTSSDEEQPLLFHLLQCHRQFQLAKLGVKLVELAISVRDEAQKEEIADLLEQIVMPQDLRIHLLVDETKDAGPASGLICAYNHDPDCNWIVSGCDYPLLHPITLEQLWTSHQEASPAVTSFVNEKGVSEPLISIWSPTALKLLKDMTSAAGAQGRKIGPNRVIRVLQADSAAEIKPVNDVASVILLTPDDPRWLRNVNTLDDWKQVQLLISSKMEHLSQAV